MIKKSILLVLSLSLAALALAGCSLRNVGNVGAASATPSPAVTFAPEATATPMTPMSTVAPLDSIAPDNTAAGNGTGMASSAAAPSPSAMTPAQAGKMAEKIAEAVERISEVDDAEVIVRDERALVAVEFDDQYSAGLDERMKKLITDTVKKADASITEVSITDDNTLYGQVKSLAERIGKATGFDELADDIGDLWNRVTGN